MKVVSATDEPVGERHEEGRLQVDEEASQASRKLAESQEAALAEQAGRQAVSGASDVSNGECTLSCRIYICRYTSPV